MSELGELLISILRQRMPDAAREHITKAQAIIHAEEFVLEEAEFAPEGFYKIPGYENYAINRNGDVYSGKRKNGLVKPWAEASGHLRVELRDQPKRRDKRFVHDLVLTTFKGARPSDSVACHRNDIPTDNRLENLYWGSRRENSNEFLRNSGNPALTSQQRYLIKVALRDGISQAQIAKAMGVGQSTISRVKQDLI